MDIKQYITNTEKQYHLRLKTVVPLDDAAMDKIEMMIAKYDPVFVSRPMKTILQREPLDFPNIDSAEVYIVDMSFRMPAAPHIVRADLRKVLDAPENFVFVRNRNEPGEIQTEIINAIADIEAEAKKRGLKLAPVLNDSSYLEAESQDNSDRFGNEYNRAFLNYLGAVEQERKDAIQRVENAPFNWLDLPDRLDQEPVQDNTNFNVNIKGSPWPIKQDVTTKPDVSYSVFGSMDLTAHEVRRAYKDAKGNTIILSRKLPDGEM